MNNIVQAWKNEAYRQSLSVEEQAMLPVSPVGEIELTDTELEAVYGASSQEITQTTNQSAAATLSSHNIIIDSAVTCIADNQADLDATTTSTKTKRVCFGEF